MGTFSVDLLFQQTLNRAISIPNAQKDPVLRPIYEYFMNILEGFEDEIIAFDIVYPSPETGTYNFTSFFDPKASFNAGVQDLAQSPDYREKVLSLSSILIEKSLERRYNLKLKDEYENLVVIKRIEEKDISALKTKEYFLFPFRFVQNDDIKSTLEEVISAEDVESVKQKIGFITNTDTDKSLKLLKSLSYTIIYSLLKNIEVLEIKDSTDIITKFTKYLVWINAIADWKMYVYISVNISQDYNFGLVLLLKNHHENIPEKAQKIINKLRKQFIKDFAQHFFEKLRKKAIINAMATIMSRNMSHNIGSHVLFYINSDTSLFGIDEVEIRKFMRYLQQRMDFIAYISTGEWLPVGSIHLLVEDVIMGFFKQKLLLKYLGFSEGVSLDNLIIEVFLNGKPVVSFNKGQIEKKYKDDIMVFIPLGVVGFQALYSILENILRNSAKYSFATKENPEALQIKIIIETDQSQNYVHLKIIDETSNMEQNKNKAEEIQHEILKPLLSETGDIELKNWGLKEIKICTIFLNNPEKGVEVLNKKLSSEESPIKVELTDGKHLTYILRLIKGGEVYDDRNAQSV